MKNQPLNLVFALYSSTEDEKAEVVCSKRCRWASLQAGDLKWPTKQHADVEGCHPWRILTTRVRSMLTINAITAKTDCRKAHFSHYAQSNECMENKNDARISCYCM